MINTALQSSFLVQTVCFVSVHNGVRPRHLARPEVPVQIRARRLREHEVVRDVAGAHPLRGPDHRVRACSRGCKASLVTVITQDTLVKTHLLFRVFVVVLFLITSRWVAAAAASSARSDAFFHSFLARSVAATRRILCWSQHSALIWLCLIPCL